MENTSSKIKKVSAIIAEYNPFHNGHKYHIEKTRENGASHIIVVMSGAIVQRGDVAIFDKHFRAKQAVLGGADLVIELPYPFSCSCAEIFANGAVNIISRLGIADELSFGCEDDDIELLKKCADISTELNDCADISGLTSQGISYPSAFEAVVYEKFGNKYSDIFHSPNNTLAIEYIKALQTITDGSIRPFAVKRHGAAHDSNNTSDGIASASHIRDMISRSADVSRLLPYSIADCNIYDINTMSKEIFMRLVQIVQSGEYRDIPDFTDELAVRFKKASVQLEKADHKALLEAVKAKNFTQAKMSRAFLNAYFGVKQKDLTLTPYARVLAFNRRGQELLNEIKYKNTGIEVSTSLSDFTETRLAQLDDLTCCFQRFCGSNSTVSEYMRKFDGFVNY